MSNYNIESSIPVSEENFFLQEETINNLKRIDLLSKRHPVNVLVAGKQGCGKSTMVKQFAARNKRPLATFQIGILSEPGQLFGEHRLKDGETYYQSFLFPQAIQTPNCVIHLEEINRPEHPKALNMLFSILAEDRKVWLDEIGEIRVADGVVFFATLNEGDEFIGTDALDAALRDRFYTSILDYLPMEIETEVLHLKTGISESDALTIVNIANQLRGNTKEPLIVSTRHTLMIAEMVAVGATVREAFINSLQANMDILESVLLSIHVKLGKKSQNAGTNYKNY